MSWLIIAAANAAFLLVFTIAIWRVMGRGRGSAERRELEKHFEHQLLHDDLTKLPNRTLFRDRLERSLARSVRRRQSCAVLSVDIDRFKLVNDSLGPDIGDGLLREAATRLDGCLRPEDTIARSGGDEFLVLLETVTGPDDAVAVADRIREALAPPFSGEGRELFLTASIGISFGRGGRDRPEDVLQNASVAVQRAKDSGRARYEIFRQEMSPHPLERLGLETDLRRAVERMDFVLEFQPLVELSDGKMVGAEALVRWEHPERGVLDPLEFVPVAEETGLILPLGRWILRQACEQAAAFGREDLRLCVNLSARQLRQPRLRLVDEVSSALASTGLRPGSLCLEITESAVTGEVDALVETLRDLKGLGVELALDDFGTGYSSLSHLRRFPLDIVKIDRSFVGEVTLDVEGEAIVHALVEVCHALGATVLAEGVETADQSRTLKGLGCDLGQGRAFSEPLPPVELRRLVESGTPLPVANAAK